ncbi:MAG: ferritin-like domain-containing protein [Actinomycetota bacterium]
MSHFGAVLTAADLHALARAMEDRAAERYRELAEAFEVSCNPDTAKAFRELAEVESRHAAEFPAAAGPLPEILAQCETDPEIADPDAVHYLMHPWHAFDLALRHEKKAVTFFQELAANTSVPEVRAAALRLVEREQGHVAHVEQRLAQLPVPPAGWDEDEDPPNWDM